MLPLGASVAIPHTPKREARYGRSTPRFPVAQINAWNTSMAISFDIERLTTTQDEIWFEVPIVNLPIVLAQWQWAVSQGAIRTEPHDTDGTLMVVYIDAMYAVGGSFGWEPLRLDLPDLVGLKSCR